MNTPTKNLLIPQGIGRFFYVIQGLNLRKSDFLLLELYIKLIYNFRNDMKGEKYEGYYCLP